MALDEHLLQRVRDLLADEPGVEENRMVGGRSFLSHGRLACGVNGRGLLVRVDEAAMAATLAEPHVSPMTMGGRALAAYVVVDPAGMGTDADLARWLRRGLAAVT